MQISHLRRLFPGLISTTSGGYLADAPPEQVDLHRFRRLRNEAVAAPPEVAEPRWSEALRCWRGIPFSGVGSEHLFYSLVTPLLEERWSAVAEWAFCALELDRAGEVVSYLTPIVREETLRERIHHLYITALWRVGERAAALSAFEEIRTRLAEELGVDPDPELVSLHAQILRADTTQATPPKGTRAIVPSTEDGFVVRNDLPRDIPDFAGREDSLGHLLGLKEPDGERARVCVLSGSGGSGKTTLAVRAGHKLMPSFPDGQLFIDLYGYTAEKDPLDARAALGSLLRAVGVPADALPDTVDERSALWRATLRGRRVLVVLDNAVGYAQVNPILPSAPETLTLITTRNDLAGISSTDYLSLGMLGEDSALKLFSKVLGEERVLREQEQALRVARICGGLPLALRVVAGRLLSRPRWSFEHVERRLSERSRRFRELQVDGQNVEAVIDLSYQSLNPEQRRAFLLLGAMLGTTVDLHGAAALLDMEPEDADDLLQELVGVCLLDELSGDVYRFHDLVGDFSRYRGVTELDTDEAEAARVRLAGHYRAGARRAAELLGPSGHQDEEETAHISRYQVEILTRAGAEAWFDRHQDNIADVVDFYAARDDGDEAWKMADSVWRFYALRGRMGLLLTSHEKALQASDKQGNRRGRAVTTIGLGIAQYISGRFNSAITLFGEARDILQEIGDEHGASRALANLGMVYERVGRFRDSAACIKGALDYAVNKGDQKIAALQWGNLAVLHQTLGEHDDALRCAENSARAAAQIGLETNQAYIKRVMGEARTGRGELEEAVRDLREALELSQRFRLRTNEIYVRNSLGVAFRASGRMAEALEEHGAALELKEEGSGHSGEAEILTDLGVTRAAGGRYEEASEALLKALSIAAERNERYTEARAALELAVLPVTVVKTERARELLADALRTFEELGLSEVDRAREALRALDA
ncbi:BTAD domain-containing putative transcriptional regulator [Nocardiopsis sp. MG754419]|uniref:AfsR/SARP family transcriptional regulator n=1 Tax=Nocardiopsis sp. MG754419 TaxID=2259865 RepID=UPI0027DC0D7C|nr:BTAD domain-containing putative transcriptional regulator [Nocardiopsis sp. MG754419]